MAKITNEWEFQGEALSWANQFVSSHAIGIDRATSEVPNSAGKRCDVVLWRDHAARLAVLEMELKTVDTPLSDPVFQADAIDKARRFGAPFVALWNMRQLHLYRTPAAPRRGFLPSDLITAFDPVASIQKTEDWLTRANKEKLRAVSDELLRATHDLLTKGTIGGRVIDATVFVDMLTERVRTLRSLIYPDFRAAMAASREFRAEVNSWALRQGLTYFVHDIEEALSGQLAYRILGQALFYHSFRRHERSLPELKLDLTLPVSVQLRNFWDAVRAYDYEALFEQSPLDTVALSPVTQGQVASFINELALFDWNDVSTDVLGAIFEQLIPESERIPLGQYYTQPQLADLLVALTIDTPTDKILDPAVGTGTFLSRALARSSAAGIPHDDALECLWGFDISAFPAELAVINLCRSDLDNRANFPRIAVRDFFQVRPTETIAFPPARRLPGSTERVDVLLPTFDVAVGNPPYVRSQQLDDLDPAYKARLEVLAQGEGVPRASKFDYFAYFIVHARKFLRPGGRLGFVTSAYLFRWLPVRGSSRGSR